MSLSEMRLRYIEFLVEQAFLRKDDGLLDRAERFIARLAAQCPAPVEIERGGLLGRWP